MKDMDWRTRLDVALIKAMALPLGAVLRFVARRQRGEAALGVAGLDTSGLRVGR